MTTKWDKHESQTKQIWQAVTLAYREAPLHVRPVQMLESLHDMSYCTKQPFSRLRLHLKGKISTFLLPFQKEGRQGATTASLGRTKWWTLSHRDLQSGGEVHCMHIHSDSLFWGSLLQKEGRWNISVTHSHSDTLGEHHRKSEADPKGEALGPVPHCLILSSVLPKLLELYRA